MTPQGPQNEARFRSCTLRHHSRWTIVRVEKNFLRRCVIPSALRFSLHSQHADGIAHALQTLLESIAQPFIGRCEISDSARFATLADRATSTRSVRVVHATQCKFCAAESSHSSHHLIFVADSMTRLNAELRRESRVSCPSRERLRRDQGRSHAPHADMFLCEARRFCRLASAEGSQFESTSCVS